MIRLPSSVISPVFDSTFAGWKAVVEPCVVFVVDSVDTLVEPIEDPLVEPEDPLEDWGSVEVTEWVVCVAEADDPVGASELLCGVIDDCELDAGEDDELDWEEVVDWEPDTVVEEEIAVLDDPRDDEAREEPLDTVDDPGGELVDCCEPVDIDDPVDELSGVPIWEKNIYICEQIEYKVWAKQNCVQR